MGARSWQRGVTWVCLDACSKVVMKVAAILPGACWMICRKGCRDVIVFPQFCSMALHAAFTRGFVLARSERRACKGGRKRLPRPDIRDRETAAQDQFWGGRPACTHGSANSRTRREPGEYTHHLEPP